jgi:hypothetical protein
MPSRIKTMEYGVGCCVVIEQSHGSGLPYMALANLRNAHGNGQSPKGAVLNLIEHLRHVADQMEGSLASFPEESEAWI